MDDLDEDRKRLIKAAFKEGLQEWLDAKFTEFGRWTAMGMAAAAFGGVILLILWSNGYHK